MNKLSFMDLDNLDFEELYQLVFEVSAKLGWSVSMFPDELGSHGEEHIGLFIGEQTFVEDILADYEGEYDIYVFDAEDSDGDLN